MKPRTQDEMSDACAHYIISLGRKYNMTQKDMLLLANFNKASMALYAELLEAGKIHTKYEDNEAKAIDAMNAELSDGDEI